MRFCFSRPATCRFDLHKRCLEDAATKLRDVTLAKNTIEADLRAALLACVAVAVVVTASVVGSLP